MLVKTSKHNPTINHWKGLHLKTLNLEICRYLYLYIDIHIYIYMYDKYETNKKIRYEIWNNLNDANLIIINRNKYKLEVVTSVTWNKHEKRE